ncbi:transporter substrate-binding domain-containing protein [Pseudomonas sp. GD03860]|uniref:transporter substrate-binding domain-containing protein n=1 Tax=Pseudomonas TaxID=286 RepID=UPI0023648B3B|nr:MULTISPECIES: transporter substrate-binding domain-containing protein [Pseudomonas]MDD2059836.1 transporter substrate-binding domain-containing protein [Pseudomonas putida]MDH0637210.1 transporter substrate-binding domain-containing protein [Pseudomonas sp. GD03860]
MRLTTGVLLATLLSPWAHAELIDDINDRGELRIAVEANMAPFNFKKEEKLAGFEIELGQLLAHELDVRAEFVVTDRDDLLPGVESGKYDIALNHIAVTPQLKERLDFSEPYGYSSAQLIVRKEEKRPLSTLDALKGHSLGVVQGSQFAEQARGVEGVDLRSYPEATQPIKDVANDQIDAAISDRLLVPYAIRDSEQPVTKGATVGPILSLAIPFQKGNPAFQSAVDNALQRIKADGRLSELSQKWFGMDASKPPK